MTAARTTLDLDLIRRVEDRRFQSVRALHLGDETPQLRAIDEFEALALSKRERIGSEVATRHEGRTLSFLIGQDAPQRAQRYNAHSSSLPVFGLDDSTAGSIVEDEINSAIR